MNKKRLINYCNMMIYKIPKDIECWSRLANYHNQNSKYNEFVSKFTELSTRLENYESGRSEETIRIITKDIEVLHNEIYAYIDNILNNQE